MDIHMNRSKPCPPQVSVLIRVRNEGRALRRVLECLRIQKLDRPFEVVVIDNESDDESAEVARTMDARVFTLPRSLFGYGRAINAGVKLCRGELIVLLSAHSWPRGDDWLSHMVHCVEERDVAAAYCRQCADGDVCRQEKARFNIFAACSYELDMEKLMQRYDSGEDVYEICCFSNAAAIVRREVAVRFPFRDLPFAEDRAFVLDCVIAGLSIAYLSTAAVAYKQPATLRNFYRIGWGCNISRHLILELAGETLGTDVYRPELGRKIARLLCKPLEIIGRAIQALFFDKAQLGSAARYAAVSYAMSLGSVVGALTWHRHRKTARCDSSVLLLAEKSTHAMAPRRMLPTTRYELITRIRGTTPS